MTRMTASREACWTRAAPDPRTLWRFGWTGEVMGELYPFVLKVLGVLMCTIAGLFLLANQRFQSRHLSENILDIRWTYLLTYINSSLLPYLSDSIPEVHRGMSSPTHVEHVSTPIKAHSALLWWTYLSPQSENSWGLDLYRTVWLRAITSFLKNNLTNF